MAMRYVADPPVGYFGTIPIIGGRDAVTATNPYAGLHKAPLLSLLMQTKGRIRQTEDKDRVEYFVRTTAVTENTPYHTEYLRDAAQSAECFCMDIERHLLFDQGSGVALRVEATRLPAFSKAALDKVLEGKTATYFVLCGPAALAQIHDALQEHLTPTKPPDVTGYHFTGEIYRPWDNKSVACIFVLEPEFYEIPSYSHSALFLNPGNLDLLYFGEQIFTVMALATSPESVAMKAFLAINSHGGHFMLELPNIDA